jgi:hypothetical protein
MDEKHRTPGRAASRPVTIVGAMLVALAVTTGIAQAAGSMPPILQVTATSAPPGQVQLPTATATILGGPTATPSRTPTLTPVLADAIDEANLRSGPGLDFDIVGTLTAGNPVPVIGRSVRFPWLLVAWEDAPNGQAWVFDQLVQVIGDITTVPVVEEPEAPTVNATQEAIQETAAVLLQTPGAAETATATAFAVPTGLLSQTPDLGGGAPAGSLPTFTPPQPYVQPEAVQESPDDDTRQGLIQPAVVIIALGAMGVLTLVVGLLRRL